jgi:hypothetical protein
MTIDFGTSWGTPLGQDLSSPSYMASGNLVVFEAVLRRWTTPTGALIDDPNYGYSLIDLVSDDLSPRDLRRAQQRLAAEATKDERVRRCVVVLALSVAGLLSVDATITTANGPFRFVLAVSAVTPLTLLVSP